MPTSESDRKVIETRRGAAAQQPLSTGSYAHIPWSHAMGTVSGMSLSAWVFLVQSRAQAHLNHCHACTFSRGGRAHPCMIALTSACDLLGLPISRRRLAYHMRRFPRLTAAGGDGGGCGGLAFGSVDQVSSEQTQAIVALQDEQADCLLCMCVATHLSARYPLEAAECR